MKFRSQFAADKAFEVECLRHRKQCGVVGSLFKVADDPGFCSRFKGGRCGDLLEKLCRHEPGTGEVEKDTAGFQQFETVTGQILIRPGTGKK